MTKRILLVDDSKTQLESLRILLTKSGFDVMTASDGAEGIEAAYKTRPDLIVSDIIMPNINGYHLCRLLKDDDQTKDIPIILLTVLNKKLDRFWGLRAGADAYLQKDSQMNILVKEIDKFLANKPALSDEERKRLIENSNFNEQNLQSKVTELLDQSLIESTIMNEFRNLSESILDRKVLNKGLFSLLASITDFHMAGIFFNNRDNKKEKRLYISQNEYQTGKETIEEISYDFFCTCLDKKLDKLDKIYDYEITEKNTTDQKVITALNDFNSKIIIPIEFNGTLIGGLCFYHKESDKFTYSRIFNIILNELTLLMRIKWLYSETKYLTIVDPLTNLYNRRYYNQILEREFSRAKRYGSELSVGMFDIDHFKNINDAYGHQFGDKVLAEISEIISGMLRRTDFAARYGGEEIAVILPETSIENAIIPIERIRRTIENKKFIYEKQEVQITISAGLASKTTAIENEARLVKLADEALYKAKQNGRNKVIMVEKS